MNNKINVEIKTKEQRDELIKQLKKMEFKKQYAKSWEDLGRVKGFYIGEDSCINAISCNTDFHNKNIFKTESQCNKSIAMSQLSQLMAEVNGNWKPKYTNSTVKYSITSSKDCLCLIETKGYYWFLTFKTKEKAEKFLKTHKDLIKQYFEIN